MWQGGPQSAPSRRRSLAPDAESRPRRSPLSTTDTGKLDKQHSKALYPSRALTPVEPHPKTLPTSWPSHATGCYNGATELKFIGSRSCF
jgi:hypothetical protein